MFKNRYENLVTRKHKYEFSTACQGIDSEMKDPISSERPHTKEKHMRPSF